MSDAGIECCGFSRGDYCRRLKDAATEEFGRT